MKPIHKACGRDNLRPAQMYFRVKDGFIWATNSHIVIKLPASEVFGDDVILSDEVLYFEAAAWDKCKFQNTKSISRDGLVFTTERGKEITAITPDVWDEKYKYSFPNMENFLEPIPQKKLQPIQTVSFSPLLMADLCASFAGHSSGYSFYFYGGNFDPIVVKHCDSEGWGVIMPIFPTRCEPTPF